MSTPEDPKQAKRVQKNFMERFKWHKVTGPRTWRPKDGDELFGFYAGQTVRKGQFGEYTVILIRVPSQGTFSLSGTCIVQLIDAAAITVGAPIHIIYKGKKELDESRTMKLFELNTADENPSELLLGRLEEIMLQ